jgi:hypothetical protein
LALVILGFKFIFWVDHAWYFPSFISSSFLGSHVCDCFSSSSVWNILLSIFCNSGLVDMNYYSLFLFWKVLISPLRLKGSFLDIPFLVGSYSLWAWITLFHAFLAFKVCAERSEMIFMCLPFHVSCCCSLAASSIISFSSLGTLIMIWREVVLFWPCLFGVWNASCIWVSVSINRLGNFLPLFQWIGFLYLQFAF